MKGTKLKKGERYLARWPNTQYYYWSTLIEQAGDKWKIQFDDGTIVQVEKSDLHTTLPTDARNRATRVTRSSPTKNRERPEVTKSPARKVRKLFTTEDNIKLGAELSDAIQKVTKSGAATVRPSSRERSVNVSKITADVKHSATDGVRSSSRERSVSVSKDTEDKIHSATDDRSSSSERSLSVLKDTEDEAQSTTDYRPSSRERSTGTTDYRPSSRERSVSVSKETENKIHSATDDRSSARERSVSVSKETEDESQSASGVRSSPYKRPVSITRETEDVALSASGVRSSPYKRPVSITRETEDVSHSASDIRSRYRRSVSITRGTKNDVEDVLGSPSRPSIRVTLQHDNMKGGAADARPSPSKGLYDVEIQKETVTRNVTRYTESYLDTDLRRRLLKEGSIGSAHLSSSPIKKSDIRHDEKVTHDVRRFTESYLDKDFRKPLLKMEGSVGSPDLRPSPIRGLDSLLNAKGTVTGDLKKYTESFLNRDFRTKLQSESSIGFSDTHSSQYRSSLSVTKDNKSLTSGAPRSIRYSLRDYEKKFLNKFPQEFGGIFATFLLLLLFPAFITSVLVFDLVPDPTKFNFSLPKQLVLIPQVTVGVLLLLFVQAVLTTVPIGTVASGPLTKIGILNMRCNGIFAALLTLILTLSTCYFEKEAAGIVVSVYSEAAVSAVLLGIIFAVIFYKRSARLAISYLNPYGCTGHKFYDFWMGREVTPRIGKYNIKLILLRFSLIVVIVLNVLIVTKAYFQGLEEDLLKSLMISTVLQSLYCLHYLSHEDIYLYSFIAISEGVGYMITVGFMSYPFILAFITKVILDYRLKASLAELCIALFAYTVGHLLLESSSYMKTLSVKDPATSLWKMRVVPTWSRGVHTKAYLGEVIVHWSFAMVAGTNYPGIFIIPAAITLSVLSRALREHKRSAEYQDEVIIKQ